MGVVTPQQVAVLRQSRTVRSRQKRHQAISWWHPLRRLFTTSFGDLLLVLVIFAVAVAIRQPNLLRLPHFTDETVETHWALSIYRGEIFPLTASDRYYGPLHAYILAGAYKSFGLSLGLTRGLVLVFGAATVSLTYLLGRTIAGRLAGLIAAGFMATAVQHIVVNSHVAWQNSTTPFYTTLAFLCFARYLHVLGAPAPSDQLESTKPRRLSSGWWIVATGFVYGLTLHTHPGTIVIAPGLALALLMVLFRQRTWQILRTPWPWLGLVSGLVAYSPVLIFNLANDLAGLERVQTRRSYAYEMSLTFEKYWLNQRDLWLELTRMLSDPTHVPDQLVQYLTSPFLLVMVTLCLGGMVLLAWRGMPLPLSVLLSTALIMPAFNRAYGQDWDRFMLTGRYITFLLPLAFIGAAVALLAIWQTVARWLSEHVRSINFRRGAATAATLLVLALILYPLLPLTRYYTEESAVDPDNASFLATVDFLRTHHNGSTPIIVGRKLDKVDLKDGAEAREIFAWLLTLERMPHMLPRENLLGVAELLPTIPADQPHAFPLLIMTRDECFQMDDRRPFQRVSPRYRLRELYWGKPSYYAVYRYLPPGQVGNCFPATGPEPGE